MIAAKIIANKGRGVVATANIAEGTTIEVAATAVIPAEQIPVINDTALFRYYFVQPGEYNSVQVVGEDMTKPVTGYFVFGLVSLCNHSNEPNAYVKWSKDTVGVLSFLIAKRDILEGEEISLFYTNIREYPDKELFV